MIARHLSAMIVQQKKVVSIEVVLAEHIWMEQIEIKNVMDELYKKAKDHRKEQKNCAERGN